MDQEYLPTNLPKEIPDHLENKEEPINTNDVKTLISWSAPGRPFVRRSKQFYSTAVLISLLLSVIAFLFSQYALILVIFSLTFVGFSFAMIPPKNFHYRISNQGVTMEDHFYLWKELYDFYFRRKDGEDILYIRTKDFFPGALIMPLGGIPKDHVRQIIVNYLPFREMVKPTFMENSADWLTKNFPLEKTKPTPQV